jgi:MFS family permease
MGSALTSFALSVWVYKNTGSVTQFALILFCATLPIVLLSPIAGALVDRLSYRRTMILSDSGSALTTLVVGWLLVNGQLEIWHIYIATAVNSSLSAFQWPAYSASVTLLVPKEQLGRANGMTQMSRAAAQLVAPLLGALCLEFIGLKGIILLDFGTFLFAVVTLLSVHFPHPLAGKTNSLKSSLLQEAKYGWNYVAARPGILGLLLFFAASNFLGGTLEVLVTPLVLSFSSTVTLGIIMSVGGIGMLAGSVVMSVWGGPKHKVNAVFGFMSLCGFCTVIAGLHSSAALIGAMAFVFFFSVPMINGCSQAILQRKVELSVQGRVFALEGAVGSASLPLAYVFAGPLADFVFEPLMSIHGPLSDNFGHLIGSGPGRGIGLLFIVIGSLTILTTIAAMRYRRLRYVEDELPDAVLDDEAPRKSAATVNAGVECA